MSYILPQVLVFQEFLAAPAALSQPLNACIVGQQFSLHRYSDAVEKAGIKVSSTYDPTLEACYVFPSRPAGGVPDLPYTKVFFENAMLQYFHQSSSHLTPVEALSNSKNKVRAGANIFQTLNGYTRDAGLLRDVKAGDWCKLVGSACGTPTTLLSQIIGLEADILPAVVGTATDDASNKGATTASATGSQTGGTTNNIITNNVTGTTYNGLAGGNPSEVYTLTVVTGGGVNQAIFRITSQSGNDDIALVTFNVAFDAFFNIGTRGLKVKFHKNAITSSSSGGHPIVNDVFIAGQVFTYHVSQLFTPTVPTQHGTYAGLSNTAYIVQVSLGGKFTDAVKPQITVTTTTGIDLSGPTNVTASGIQAVVGTQGVYISFAGAGLCKGDRYIIPVVAAAPGQVRTLVLANNVPDGFRGVCPTGGGSSSSSVVHPDLDLTLYIRSNFEVPAKQSASINNWTQTDTKVCLEAAITGYDASWAIAGVPQALYVKDAAVFVQHRDRMPTYCNTVGTVSTPDDVATLLGTVDPDNELAFGVYKAALNANGEEVKFVGVCSHSPVTLNDWLAAFELLVGRDDVYSLVPLSQDKTVLDAALAHCLAQSTPENGRWRIAWLNMAAAPVVAVDIAHAGGPLLATIKDDPAVPGADNILVEVSVGGLIAAGIQSGDTVRALYTTDGSGNLVYTEFTVDVLINDNSIRLVAGPALPVNVASKIEIWRTLSKPQLAANLALLPGEFSNRRAYLVWPDVVGNAGVTFPGYFLCAALAGLRSGVLPHQGLTNVEVLGFDDLTRTTEFLSANQLNTMAASGYWIVTRDFNNGTIFSRHELSCGDQTDVNQREQNITTNLDNISFGFLDRLKAFIGKGNVTPVMIQILQGEIVSLIEQYKNTISIDRLGPQIISATILELRQSPTFKDRVICRISLVLPAPLNNVELHLVVS